MMLNKITNVIPIVQDKSIYNIITYTLNNNNIKTHKIETAIKNHYITPNTLIIIDTDLGNNYTKDIINKIKKINASPYIILAISKNYRYFLTEPLHPAINGIIYKPFDIEELFQIVNN